MGKLLYIIQLLISHSVYVSKIMSWQ